MKKITGLLAVLVAGAALAAPAMARDWNDYNNCAPANTYTTYNTYPAVRSYTAVRHDVGDLHNVRHDARPYRGRVER